LIGVAGARGSQAGLAAMSTAPLVQAPQEIDPKPLYTKLCEPCHGREGKAPAPEMGFVARQWKHGTSTAEIVKSITQGVPTTAMLPFKGKLKDPEIAALARYVRSLDKRLQPEKGGGS
jgi:mono/diheme cytochrome c family protein